MSEDIKLEEKEIEENKEFIDMCKERESDIGKKKVEYEIFEGNVVIVVVVVFVLVVIKVKYLVVVEERKIKFLVVLLVEI